MSRIDADRLLWQFRVWLVRVRWNRSPRSPISMFASIVQAISGLEGLKPHRVGVTRSEAKAIIAAIKSIPTFDDRIIRLQCSGFKQIRVEVGFIAGPLCGEGDIITATQTDEGWLCEVTGWWES